MTVTRRMQMTAVVSRAVQWTWRACVLLLVLAALSGPALAAKGGNGKGGGGGHGNSGGGGKGGGGGRGAPEIDPGTLASTLTVLTGGALMLADRRRKR